MASIVHRYKANQSFSSSRLVEEVTNIQLADVANTESLIHGGLIKECVCFCARGERDTGFEVSPDEAEPCIGRADDQTDAIPTSSSSDSLSMSDELDARATLPTPSDILVSYSTFPGVCVAFSQRRIHLPCSAYHPNAPSDNAGYVSWRDTQSGSWYVETLERILEENAATDDLVTMLMMVSFSSHTPLNSCHHVELLNHLITDCCVQVNHEVSQNSAKGLYKQMPGSFNFLRKLLHFQAQE